MNPANRIGAPEAEVILFNKGGRDFRVERLSRGEEVPRDFFYGFFELEKAGVSCAMMSSSGRLPGGAGLIADTVERAFARFTAIGARPLTTRLSAPHIRNAKVLISYTDGFSLSLGLGFPRGGPVLIGGFHGLSDVEDRTPASLQGFARGLITRALAGLDHAFFFGPADRAVAIERYGLRPDRSSILPFGVDTEFWRALPGEPQEDFVVAVGQDRNRDYDLLAAAPGQHPTRIVTRQRVAIPDGATHVQTTSGDFFGSDSMTDEALRRLYNRACAVIVPLKDVYQPTGYSVTLQAMSCGRPVVLSAIKGLWAPELLKDGENCLLVPPGDAAALGAAIARLRADAALRTRLGEAARTTALAHFSLDRMGAATVALARLGLSLAQARLSAVA